MLRAAVFIAFASAQIVSACSCLVSRSACQEVATSNVVFIGTVVAIEPTLLDYWKPAGRRNWRQDTELVALRSDVGALKNRYLELLFDLLDVDKKRIRATVTPEELETVMARIVDRGPRVRFKVSTTFQHKDDDDSQDAGKSEFADVWNQAGDCGVSFQKGETYLVYANEDERSDRLETNMCHRTARLSDSGEDLTYLHFFEKGGAAAARLEGFVTSELGQVQQDRFQYSGKIGSPVADVVVELRSKDDVRYSAPEPGGRFVFDGLAEGEYQVSVFARGFPETAELLSGPKRVRVRAKGCGMVALWVSRGTGRP